MRLERITKRFGNIVAVDNVTMIAEAGKLTTLLGPSGCGKTTTLRLIGGFLEPDEGDIFIGERRVNGAPAYARSTRTVFQSYALFPHMTVFENVAFGLRATSVPRREMASRVEEALKLVGLTGFAERSPGQLSGGQQQRVAFARALVTRPEVLLLDEPLSNLDAKLRIHMRVEIRKLQQELGITTVYVTHDQEEAMSLSDHVVVMNAGRIEQQGRPFEIYEKPASAFVAGFIGKTNFVMAEVVNLRGAQVRVRALGGEFTVAAPEGRELHVRQRVQLVVRPEHLHIGSANGVHFRGRVLQVSYLGAAASYELALEGGASLVVHDPAPRGANLHASGSEVTVGLETERVYIVPE